MTCTYQEVDLWICFHPLPLQDQYIFLCSFLIQKRRRKVKQSDRAELECSKYIPLRWDIFRENLETGMYHCSVLE